MDKVKPERVGVPGFWLVRNYLPTRYHLRHYVKEGAHGAHQILKGLLPPESLTDDPLDPGLREPPWTPDSPFYTPEYVLLAIFPPSCSHVSHLGGRVRMSALYV
jgi:hypothetical protein